MLKGPPRRRDATAHLPLVVGGRCHITSLKAGCWTISAEVRGGGISVYNKKSVDVVLSDH